MIFQTEKDVPHEKAISKLLSKPWATYETNFWERKIHGVRESNWTSSDLTVRFWGTRINPPTNVSAKIRLI